MEKLKEKRGEMEMEDVRRQNKQIDCREVCAFYNNFFMPFVLSFWCFIIRIIGIKNDKSFVSI